MKKHTNTKRMIGVGGVTATLLLFFGTIAPVFGQEEHGKEQEKQPAKPTQQRPQQARPAPPPQQRAQERPQQAKPAQPPQQRAQERPQQARPAQPQQQRAQQPQPHGGYAVPQRTQEQARGWEQKRGWQQGGGWQGQASWQQDRSSNWQADHRTWAQRGGYGGYYIPQDRFALYFGARHWFRIGTIPIIFDGYPRFQYGGFSFMMVDPWPVDWGPNWYDTDDVYVGYDNGYYLYNRTYPGFPIALSVVL